MQILYAHAEIKSPTGARHVPSPPFLFFQLNEIVFVFLITIIILRNNLDRTYGSFFSCNIHTGARMELKGIKKYTIYNKNTLFTLYSYNNTNTPFSAFFLVCLNKNSISTQHIEQLKFVYYCTCSSRVTFILYIIRYTRIRL